MADPKSDEPSFDEETQWREEALERMLNKPPRPHKEIGLTPMKRKGTGTKKKN